MSMSYPPAPIYFFSNRADVLAAPRVKASQFIPDGVVVPPNFTIVPCASGSTFDETSRMCVRALREGDTCGVTTGFAGPGFTHVSNTFGICDGDKIERGVQGDVNYGTACMLNVPTSVYDEPAHTPATCQPYTYSNILSPTCDVSPNPGVLEALSLFNGGTEETRMYFM
jgi:hypothetical protein